jgi:hypothetical protein
VPDRSPRVADQAPRILLHWMIMIYFRNMGFESFSFSTLPFIQSVFSRSYRSSTMHPSPSDGHDLLWESGFESFSFSTLISFGVFSPEVKYQVPHVLLHQTVMIYFGSFGFPTLDFLQVILPEVSDQAPRVLIHRMVMIYFGNLGFGSFSFSLLYFL